MKWHLKFTFKKSIINGFDSALLGIFVSNGSRVGGTGSCIPYKRKMNKIWKNMYID